MIKSPYFEKWGGAVDGLWCWGEVGCFYFMGLLLKDPEKKMMWMTPPWRDESHIRNFKNEWVNWWGKAFRKPKAKPISGTENLFFMFVSKILRLFFFYHLRLLESNEGCSEWINYISVIKPIKKFVSVHQRWDYEKRKTRLERLQINAQIEIYWYDKL